MKEYSFLFQAAEIKRKQELLNAKVSGILDALLQQKQEVDSLKEHWHGEAAKQYTEAFNQVWESAFSQTEAFQKKLLIYREAEQTLAACEKQICAFL